jgi:outer membrane receptor protein involved in Fe transport
MGGAIRYITPRPDYAEFSGRAKAELSTTSHGGENYELEGAAGGPITENVAFRASGFVQHDGGIIDIVNDATGVVRDENANSSQSWGGRLALSARFSDRIEATASVLYQDIELDALSYIHTVRQSGGVITPLEPFQKTERVDTSNRDRFFLPNLLVNADLGFAQLTSSTSWQDQRVDLVNDLSYFITGLFGLPPALGDQVQTPSARQRDFTAFVQEVRLVSNPGRLEWLFGGYYRQSKLESHQVIGSNLGPVLGAPPQLFLADGAIETFDEISEVTELAAFGEVTFKITEALKVTGGLRYSSLSREVFQQEILAPLLTGGGPQPPAVSPPESTEHPLTPKFSATYDFSDDAMVYATAAKGFREGGPNPPLFLSPACIQALADLGLTAAPTSYESDNLWSYELGAKGQTADRRLRATAALYQIDWSNIQQAIQLGQQCGNSPVANLGAARIRGIELDAQWRPVEGLTLDGSLNYYFQAELTEDRITGSITDPVTGETVPVVGAVAGTPLASVPEFTLALAAEYGWQLADGWGAYARAEYQYIGKANRFIATTGANPNLEAPSYDVVSARLGVTHGPWEINLFADNLFDANPIISRGGGFAPGGALGFAETTIRPRTVGVSLGARF